MQRIFKNFFGESSSKVGIMVASTPVASLTIMASPTSVYVGNNVTFSGKFTLDGKALAEKTVRLLKNGIQTKSTLTDTNGNYSMVWTADIAGSYSFWAEADDPALPPPGEPTSSTDDKTTDTATATYIGPLRRMLKGLRLFNPSVVSDTIIVNTEGTESETLRPRIIDIVLEKIKQFRLNQS